MILNVLKAIVDDKMIYKKAIAQKVGVQPETLDDILRLLVQRGYLRKEVSSADEPKCGSCPMSGSCHDEGNEVTFYVTERGRKAVHQKS